MMGPPRVTIILIVGMCWLGTHAAPMDKRSMSGPPGLHGDSFGRFDLEKRPFCNAFTGCGRKRSDPLMAASASSSEDVDDFEVDEDDNELQLEAAAHDRIRGAMMARLRPEGGLGFFPGYMS